MKSVKFSALMAVAVIAASCAKEGTHSVDESNKVALEPMCIEASDESQTKTVLGGTDGRSVNWTDGDEIAVYSNIDYTKGYTKGYTFPATKIDGNSATFNGEVPVGTESFIAVYPPKSVVSVNAEGVTVNIPANQTPAAGTFAEEHNITVAQGTKTPGDPSVGDIIFNNVCSYVKFTVPKYVSDVKKVTITSDYDIAGDLAVDLAKASSSIVSNGKNSISMSGESGESGSFGAGNTFLFVIAPGTVKNFSIYIETASGNWTRTVSQEFTATAGRPVKLGTVDFKQVALEAEAKHVYEDGTGNLFYEDGNDRTLVGTDLSVNLGLDGFLKYASYLKFEVKKKDGTTVRKYESKSVASSTVSFNCRDYADEWPYLPYDEGKEYTIEGSYTRPDGSTQTISGTFTVPKPTFKVNAPLATTNYDTYKDLTLGDAAARAAAANALDGSTIYGVAGNGVSISDKILNNTEYKSLIGGYSFTIGNNSGTVDKNGNATNQTWGAHNVFATYTFDGVSETSPARICHVTGLPYRAPSETKFNAEGKSWTKVSGGGTSINSDSIDLTPTSAPSAKSPAFHMPGTVKVKVTNAYTKNVTSTLSAYTYKMTLNDGTEVVSHSSKTKGPYSFTWLGEMNPSRTVFTCSYNYTVRGNDVTVKSVIVEYN